MLAAFSIEIFIVFIVDSKDAIFSFNIEVSRPFCSAIFNLFLKWLRNFIKKLTIDFF